MYTPHHKEYPHTHHSYTVKFVEDLFQLQGGIFIENKIFAVLTDFHTFHKWQCNFYTLQNFKEFLLCVSACTQIKEAKQYGIEGETKYEKQTVRRKEKREGGREG